MTGTIKVNRKDFIAKLASIKDDNVSIADVVISRNNLLQALRLQTDDALTLTYGKVSWEDKFETQGCYKKYWREVKVDNEPCVQLSYNHTVMRFLNRPNAKYGQAPKVTPLNFIDHTEPKPELTGIPLDTQALLKALSFVLPCVASEQARPVLNCVLLDCGEDIIKLVAADGYRLGIATIPAKGIAQVKVLIHPAELITFLKSIKPIGKGKTKHYPEVYVTPEYKTLKFAYIGGSIEIDKQTYAFPDYTQLIPKDGTKVEFIASDMLIATKALSYIAKDSSGIIRLQFKVWDTAGKIILTTKSEDLGATTAECDAKVESDCNIAIDTKYLIDLLRLCADSIIDMRLTVPSAPMTFNIGNDKQWIVMPMFVQW